MREPNDKTKAAPRRAPKILSRVGEAASVDGREPASFEQHATRQRLVLTADGPVPERR